MNTSCPVIPVILATAFLFLGGMIVIVLIERHKKRSGRKTSGRCAPQGLSQPAATKGTATDLARFNDLFVRANQALTGGDTDALRAGISLFIEALEFAGSYKNDLAQAINCLYGALSHHERADTKGPWNRDLSGYGLFCWKNDLYDRDVALQKAWPHIETINNGLKKSGLGWNY